MVGSVVGLVGQESHFFVQVIDTGGDGYLLLVQLVDFNLHQAEPFRNGGGPCSRIVVYPRISSSEKSA